MAVERSGDSGDESGEIQATARSTETRTPDRLGGPHVLAGGAEPQATARLLERERDADEMSAQTSTETKVVVCGTPISVLVPRVIADVWTSNT